MKRLVLTAAIFMFGFSAFAAEKHSAWSMPIYPSHGPHTYHMGEPNRGVAFIPVLAASAFYLLSDHSNKVQYGVLAAGLGSGIVARQVVDRYEPNQDGDIVLNDVNVACPQVRTGEVAYIDGWKMVAVAAGAIGAKFAFNQIFKKASKPN